MYGRSVSTAIGLLPPPEAKQRHPTFHYVYYSICNYDILTFYGFSG